MADQGRRRPLSGERGQFGVLFPRSCVFLCHHTNRCMASLLRPEQVEELRQIFDLFDSDGDGLLEVEEVGAIWASCGTLLTEAEVRK